jgi:NitT/TauT family transport system substrate-binding protein
MIDAVSKRDLLRAGFGLSAALALPRVARAATTLKVGKASPESIGFIPVDIGVKHGIFSPLGLDVEIIGFNGGAKMHQALVAGSLDIALGSGPDLPLIVKGEPARAVATTVNAPAYLVVMAKPDGSIKTIADLKGKTINVASLVSLTGWLGTQLWKGQGWQAGDVKFTTSPNPAALALMRTGQIDAMITDGTFALAAENRGDGRIIHSFGTSVKDFHTHMIFASDALIAKNPDAVRAFIKGWFQSIARMRSDRAGTITDIADVLGLAPSVATRAYDAYNSMYNTDGHFNATALAALSKSFVDMGSLPEEPKNLGALYTEGFL